MNAQAKLAQDALLSAIVREEAYGKVLSISAAAQELRNARISVPSDAIAQEELFAYLGFSVRYVRSKRNANIVSRRYVTL